LAISSQPTDFSNDNRNEPFVRYINRWHLEKQDPDAPPSTQETNCVLD